MKKYLLIALAALAFAACAKINDGVSPEQTGEIEQSYIAINLMSSDINTRVNNATPDFNDGEKDERNVYTVHFFFYRQGAPFAVNASGTAPGGDQNWLQASNPGFNEDLDADNISAYSNVMLVLSNYKGQYPDQIVAVINWNPTEKVYKLDDLHTELVSLKGNENGFVMSNSVYKSGDKVVDATAISGTYPTEAEASAAPVEIYVERVAAKVKVNTPTTDIAGDWDNTKQRFDTGKSSQLVSLDEKKVYVNILNWSLFNARAKSDLLKSINTTWTDEALGLTWNDSPRFRSYWADAATYTGEFINKNIFNWRDGNILGTATYCGENTAPLTGERTKLVLKGRLVNAEGEPFELVKWNGQEMVEVETLKKAVASQLQYIVYSYVGTGAETTYTPISYEDIECISGSDASAPDGVENYQVYFTLSTGGSDKDWAIKSGDVWTPKDDIHINEYIAKNIPAATVYAEGQTYYFIDIKHLGTSGKEAEYGIIRNHIYDIEIQSIKGYGTPVFIPTGNIVVPEVPKEEEASFVAAKINVLSWRVVQQGVDIVQ